MTAATRFEKLFEPGQIGTLKLRNRVVMAPMVSRYGGEEGFVTERIKNYYEARARGGAGLVIIEATYVDRWGGQVLPNQLGISDDRYIPGLRELAQVIQRHGAKAALQLHYAGPSASPAALQRVQPVAPSSVSRAASAVSVLGTGEPPRELSVNEIEHIITCFARGAKRAVEAGFDGVEIHGAHVHLLATFLSSYWNRRRDAYGGNLENRARIVLEIVEACRKAVGPDYPLWCRINGEEEGTGGINLEEAQQLARWLQDAGVDAVNVSAQGYYLKWAFPSGLPSGRPWIYPRGWQVPLAEGIKKAVQMPVMTIGRLNPQQGERILQDGKADFIVMGRALVADPDLPNKAASGRSGEIVPCLSCNECYDFNLGPMHCTINAALGREREFIIRPTKRHKKVLIVGGGPAGMEAARVAAQRGHDVTLYEKGHELGGQLIAAAIPPSRRGIQTLTGYLKSQVGKLNVKIELGKEVTRELIDEIKPDTVILATGVTTFVPEIPGVNRGHVIKALDVLAGQAKVGERVVVIGGELIGCNVAEFLAEKGKKVTITRRGPAMLHRAGPTWRELTLNHLLELGVDLITGVRYEEITDTDLVITTQQGERQTIPADTIVLAAGARPNRKLFSEIEGRAPEIYLAGDCAAPRRALHAVADASRIAREI